MTTPESAPSSYSTHNSPAASSKKTLAITSLILGIAGLVGLFIPVVNFLTLIGAIVGLVLGFMSRRREPAGRGLALAGIITSAVAIVLFIVFAIIGVALLGSMMESGQITGM